MTASTKKSNKILESSILTGSENIQITCVLIQQWVEFYGTYDRSNRKILIECFSGNNGYGFDSIRDNDTWIEEKKNQKEQNKAEFVFDGFDYI